MKQQKQNGPETVAAESQALAFAQVSPSGSGSSHFNAPRPALLAYADASNDAPLKTDDESTNSSNDEMVRGML